MRSQEGRVIYGDTEAAFPKAIKFDNVSKASNDLMQRCTIIDPLPPGTFVFSFNFFLAPIFFSVLLSNYEELGCITVSEKWGCNGQHGDYS